MELVQPTNIIEVGLGLGGTSLYLEGYSFKPKWHFIIEPDVSLWNGIGIKNLQKLNRKNITLFQDTSQKRLAMLSKSQTNQIGLMFMDGDVKFDGVMVDMHWANKLLVNGGIIIIRNITNPAVRKSVMFNIKNLPYEIFQVPPLYTWGIKHIPFFGNVLLRIICKYSFKKFCILQKTRADSRPWNHYVPF